MFSSHVPIADWPSCDPLGGTCRAMGAYSWKTEAGPYRRNWRKVHVCNNQDAV